MWRILGEPTSTVRAGETLRTRLLDISKRMKGRPRFVALLERAELIHRFDPIEVIQVLEIKLPHDVTDDDVQFCKEFVTKVIKKSEFPVIDFNGESQRAIITIIAAEEPPIIGTRSPYLRDKAQSD